MTNFLQEELHVWTEKYNLIAFSCASMHLCTHMITMVRGQFMKKCLHTVILQEKCRYMGVLVYMYIDFLYSWQTSSQVSIASIEDRGEKFVLQWSCDYIISNADVYKLIWAIHMRATYIRNLLLIYNFVDCFVVAIDFPVNRILEVFNTFFCSFDMQFVIVELWFWIDCL